MQLYLQSYQLILWKQCYALIHTVGLPAELESVIKDLWALRLQLLKDRVDPESEGNMVFSSQRESEKEAESKNDGKREWKVRGKEMPVLNETLGLCYLGMILLRLPVSLGDVYRYAKSTLFDSLLSCLKLTDWVNLWTDGPSGNTFHL